MNTLREKIVSNLKSISDVDLLNKLAVLVETLTQKDSTVGSYGRAEDKGWLEAELSTLSEYEPYEWQEGELEQGIPIEIGPDGEIMLVTDDL